MRIQHNLSAINSQRNIFATNQTMAKNLEKLSSGYRINRAGDDAAGLAISESMRSQITGMNQGKRNTQDGISLVQTVEGALTEVHSMLNRMKGMAVQSANGTYTDLERSMLDSEMQQLKEEINRIGESTTFSGVPLFTNGGTSRKVSMTSFYGCTLDLANGEVSVNYSGSVGRAASQVSSSGGYDLLAEKIATEYIPNAAKQILDTFTSLQSNLNGEKIEMDLLVEYIDGPNGTAAYAKASFYAQGRPFNMQIVVDTADFSDASIQSGSPDEDALKSTIAHELMHSVMQYTLTDGMFGRNGQQKYPEWFVEGTAQLAGGGFPTGWNNKLQQIANQLTGTGDGSQDNAIANYLKAYDVKERPYGHGYLAAAYIGYLANGGSGPVTGANIAHGMDRIFTDLLRGKSLNEVLNTHTGGKIKDSSSLEALFDNPSTDLVGFVRELSIASKGGAGSIITSSLSTGGAGLIGNAASSDLEVKSWRVGAAGKLFLYTGDGNQSVEVELYRLDDMGLGLSGANLSTQDDANSSVDTIDTAIDKVSKMRSHYGAIQNRLEHTYANLSNTVENLTAAESRIRDVDMAFAITEHVRNQILFQSGQAMLAQANHVPENVLSLIGA